jgi:hypothetical protein
MDSATVLSLAKQYGPKLALPARSVLNGVAVMCAFAENESSFGANCKPRYEQAYDVGGRYAANPEQAALLEKYGRAAAFSYGPWQILPCNAPGIAPADLDEQPELCAVAFVHDMNRRVLPHANSLGQMGQIYNGGHVSAAPLAGVMRYVASLQGYYVTWFNKLKSEASADAPSYA